MAALSRQETLKPLPQLLAPLTGTKRQTLAEQRQALMEIAAKSGLTIREKGN